MCRTKLGATEKAMVTTQLGGPNLKNKTLFVVKQRLTRAGVRVIHPLNDGFFLMQGRYFTFNPRKWLRYEVDVDYYESILNSDLHVVCNENELIKGTLDYETCLGILFAMIHKKPIILTATPKFGKTNDLFFRELLGDRLTKLPVIALHDMAGETIKQQLGKLPRTVDYALTEQEVTLIKSRLKEHFRRLLRPLKNRSAFFALSR